MTLETVDLRRAAAAFAVILLHIAVLAVLMRATVAPGPKLLEPRALLLQIFVPVAPKKPAPLPPPRTIRPVISVAPDTITLPPPADNPPSLQGLHQSLFGCTPENLANLTPEQRARCGQQALGPNPDETNSLRNLPSRAHDARHWQRALARKQNPTLLPCMSSQGIGVGPQTLICIGKGAVSGFGDLDEQTGYGDKPPVDVHVPNNGDPVPPWSPR